MEDAVRQVAEFDTPEATACFAARLAPGLKPGDVILLDGPIGAGKTHFARAVIQTRLIAAGRIEDVPSPTYTLVQTYDDDEAEIWHADLYRLSHPDEIEELGLNQAFDSAICLVEWPDRLGDLAPEGALWLSFTSSDQPGMRRMTARSRDRRWTGPVTAALGSAALDIADVR